MDREGFTAYLNARAMDEERIAATLGFADRFEAWLVREGITREALTEDDAVLYMADLEGAGLDTEDALLGLARYARFARCRPLYTVVFALLDGGEVMDNLHRLLGERAGAALRDRVFAGIAQPSWGTDNRVKARRMQVVVARLEEMVPREVWTDILSGCLRDLPESFYQEAREAYDLAPGMDAFLDMQQESYLEEMEHYHTTGELYFNQPVTDEVLAFLRSRPDITRGEYRNGQVFVTKIPYQADDWLRETDPVRRRYLYCHCPWARESLLGRPDIPPVSAEWCRCSAGFVKKKYESVFGQPLEADVVKSVLRGDDACVFRVWVPDDLHPGGSIT